MMTTQRADSDIHIETPEGIELVTPLADPIARGYAFVIDLLLRLGLVFLLSMALRAVDLTSINLSTSMTRNLLRTADMMPACYGFGIATMLFNKDNKRLGDIAARTVVVSTERPKYRRIEVDETALAPDVMLTQEEQRAVIDFARFYEITSRDRAHEIAYNLHEALEEPDIQKLTTRLRRYAKWFLGER